MRTWLSGHRSVKLWRFGPGQGAED